MSAWVLLLPASAAPSRWFPGDPSYPDLSCTVNYFWLLSQRGWLGATHSRLLMYPNVADFVLLAGFQLDALVARPFIAVFGLTAGFTLFQVTALWLAGASAAWLAGCWWRSPVAALVGGIVCQSSPVLVRELAYGRPTQVFGIIFVPLALGLFARALVTKGQGSAFLSGLMLGFAALSYWFYGFFCGLGMASLWVLSLVERRWAFRSVFACLAGTSLVVGLPIAYTLVGQAPMAAMDTTLWDTVVHGGRSMVLAQLLEERDLGSLALSEGLLGITPIVVLLGFAGAWGQRARRWVAPALWLALATLIAAGPIINLPGSVPLP
ncbi:MAG: hypothetical protein GXP62_11595, partial [Oligoflexia bacterium]|nr:hypothetical protein [Oligoflexia bacterium]